MTSDFRFESDAELPGSDLLGRLAYTVARPVIARLWDVKIEGIEHVPRRGPAIVTPNHLSFCDSIFVPYALPRRTWAIGKGEYLDSWKTRYIFPALGMIPVDRSGGDAAARALETAAEVLKRDHLFMIYPEGTRSRSTNLHKGRTGAARLAERCNAPILPVGHVGTLDVQPPDTFKMKVNLPVTVRIGEPMWIDDFGEPGDPRRMRRMTDALMFRIGQLSEQTYVDTYAGSSDTPLQKPPTLTRPTPPPARKKAKSPVRPLGV